MKGSKKVLARFVLSFALVMLIPFLVFMIMTLGSISKEERQRVMANYQNATDSIGEQLENLVSQADAFRLRAMNERYFYSFQITRDGGAYVYLEQTLKNFAVTNASFGQVGLYHAGTDRVYTSFGTFSHKTFQNTVADIPMTSISPSWIKMTTVHINDFEYQYMVFNVPFEVNYEKKTPQVLSNLLFFIEKDMMDALCNPMLIFEDTRVLITYDGELVYDSEGSYLEPEYQKSDNGRMVYSANNTQYIQLTCESSPLLVVKSYVKQATVTAAVNQMLFLYIVVTFSALMIGCLLITVFVKLNYRPIKMMDHELKNAKIELSHEHGYFESVAGALKSLVDQNSQMRKNSARLKRDAALLKLFTLGVNGENANQVIELCRREEITLDLSFFSCIRIEPLEPVQTEMLPMRISLEQDMAYLYVSGENNSIIILLNASQPRAEWYDTIYQKITEILEVPCRAGAGGFKRSVMEIERSLYEALYALSFAETNICLYDDLAKTWTSNVLLIFRETSALHNAIVSADRDKVALAVSAIRNALSLINDERLMHSVHFCILSQCLDAYQMTAGKDTRTLLDALKRLSSKKMMKASEEKAMIQTVLDDAVAQTQVAREREEKKTARALDIDELLAFIQAQYLSADFSTTLVAEEFSTSPSNISHFFKNKTGITLTDYVNQLRFDTAKQLLMHTEYSVSYIGQYVGYYHTSNFIKRFKAIEGMTPSEFRRLSQR